MQFVWFSVLLVCSYVGTLFGFSFWLKRRSKEEISFCLEPAGAAFLMGAVMLGLTFCSVIFSRPNLSLYTWIVSALFAVLYLSTQWPQLKAKMVWIPLLCFSGSYVLHKTFPEIPMGAGMFMGVTAVWILTMMTVVFFDRLPLLSFLTMGSWTLAFTVMGIANSEFPPEFVVLALLTFAPLWAIVNIFSREKQGLLGEYASPLLGFIMGSFIAMCIMFSSTGSAITLMGYYILEAVLFALAWLGLKPLGIQKGNFAFMTVLQKGHPEAIIKVVFYHLVILSLLATLMWQTTSISVLLLALVVVLVDVYNRFRVSGAPAASIKEIVMDMKNSFKELTSKKKTKVAVSKLKHNENPKESHKQVSKKKNISKISKTKKKKKK